MSSGPGISCLAGDGRAGLGLDDLRGRLHGLVGDAFAKDLLGAGELSESVTSMVVATTWRGHVEVRLTVVGKRASTQPDAERDACVVVESVEVVVELSHGR